MSDTGHNAKKFREAMKRRAQDRVKPGSDAVDASGWKPEGSTEPLNTTAKVGLRPISKRAFKRGGKVSGEDAKHNASRAERKAGGVAHGAGAAAATSDCMKGVDVKKGASKEHIGGLKRGGLKRGGLKRGGKAGGGPLGGFNAITSPEQANGVASASNNAAGVAPNRFNFGPSGGTGILHVKKGGKVVKKAGGSVADGELEGTRPKGGREAHARGGRAGKGKMNVNIIIGTPRGPEQPAQPPAPPHMVPPPAPPMPGGAPPMGGMPGGAPPMPTPPMPGSMPMGRATGGRAYPIEDAAGGGKGRLEKVKSYGLKPA
jgi:hypothetical protein